MEYCAVFLPLLFSEFWKSMEYCAAFLPLLFSEFWVRMEYFLIKSECEAELLARLFYMVLRNKTELILEGSPWLGFVRGVEVEETNLLRRTADPEPGQPGKHKRKRKDFPPGFKKSFVCSCGYSHSRNGVSCFRCCLYTYLIFFFIISLS